jgi:hypothetical protein
MTKYRRSLNLSYARAPRIIQGAENTVKSNNPENNLDWFFDSEIIVDTQIQTGMQVRQKPRFSIPVGELTPSLEKFGFANVTYTKRRAKHNICNALIYDIGCLSEDRSS